MTAEVDHLLNNLNWLNEHTKDVLLYFKARGTAFKPSPEEIADHTFGANCLKIVRAKKLKTKNHIDIVVEFPLGSGTLVTLDECKKSVREAMANGGKIDLQVFALEADGGTRVKLLTQKMLYGQEAVSDDVKKRLVRVTVPKSSPSKEISVKSTRKKRPIEMENNEPPAKRPRISPEDDVSVFMHILGLKKLPKSALEMKNTVFQCSVKELNKSANTQLSEMMSRTVVYFGRFTTNEAEYQQFRAKVKK